jgi:hypothetical protein
VQFGWSPVKSGAVTRFVFAGTSDRVATTPLIRRFGFRSVCRSTRHRRQCRRAQPRASAPVALIAALALVSGITRSTGFTAHTVGLADMQPS